MKLLKLMSMLCVAVLFFACGDDDDGDNGGSGNNQFTYGGSTYSLANGYLEEWGENAGMDSYDWDVILISSGLDIDVSTGEASGTGDYVYLDLNTSSETGLVAGTYTFEDERAPMSIVASGFGINYDTETETGDEYDFNGGTVTVAIDGSTTTVTFDLTVVGGGSITGNFSGELHRIE